MGFRLPIRFICVLVVTVLVTTVSFFLTFERAFAYESYMDRIPNGEKFGCLTCHKAVSTIPDSGPETPPVASRELNNFGIDFKRFQLTWGIFMAYRDSDNDSFQNGRELLDPYGSWKPGDANPQPLHLVTNPGDAQSNPNTIPVQQAGDVNNDNQITIEDAQLVLNACVGLIELSETAFLAADMNGDKKLLADDAILILKKVPR